MIEPDKTNSDESQTNSTLEESGVGDLETAGETTAADVISGPADTRPVGLDTLVKVADTRDDEAHSNNEDLE